jgi:hypothetical protein
MQNRSLEYRAMIIVFHLCKIVAAEEKAQRV